MRDRRWFRFHLEKAALHTFSKDAHYFRPMTPESDEMETACGVKFERRVALLYARGPRCARCCDVPRVDR